MCSRVHVIPKADVVKLANTHGSEPCAARLVGSSPTIGTIFILLTREGRRHVRTVPAVTY